MALDPKDWSRQRRHYERRIKQGRCPYCANGLLGRKGKSCAECLAKRSETQRRRKGMKGWEDGKKGRPPLSSEYKRYSL